MILIPAVPIHRRQRHLALHNEQRLLDVPQVILRPGETAKRLNITPRTLARWRVSGIGPPYVRVGPRCIGYLPADIDRWAESRRFTSRAAELIADAASADQSQTDPSNRTRHPDRA